MKIFCVGVTQFLVIKYRPKFHTRHIFTSIFTWKFFFLIFAKMEFQNGAKTLFFRFFHFCVGGNDVGGNCVGGNEREFFSAHFDTHMGF